MASSFREGGDIALWLHNKLGSTDDTWSSHTITGQLNPEVLRNIRKCFEALQPNVKVKILLSFLHLPRRQLDEPEWRQELNAIMETAAHDTDQWVMMVADLMKTFPNLALFNLDEISETAEEPFGDVLKELTKIVKKSTDRASLPLEFQFLGKQALATAAGHGLPQIQRHFTIKRKPKSAALRAELLMKSDATKKSLGIGGGIGVSAVKSRNFNEKKNVLDSSLMKKSGTGAFFKSPTRGPLGVPARGNLASRNQSIGIKVLDIKDQPLSFKDARKRKKDEEEKDKKDRDAKKEKLSTINSGDSEAASEVVQNGARNGVAKTTAIPTTTTPQKTTPDYAASLGLTSTLTPASTSVSSVATVPSTASGTLGETPPCPPPTLPDYAPNAASIFPAETSTQQPSFSPSKLGSQTAGRVSIASRGPTTQVNVAQVNVAPGTLQQQQPQEIQQMQAPTHTTGLAVAQQAVVNAVATNVAASVAANAAANANSMANASAADTKKGLSLTKEQMLEAQEMFKTSNKVTRPEKALILGFMAGSRDNPCPEKGHILTIRLSEREEMVQPDSTKLATLMHVETYFQMNYETGDWKRIKKCRPLPAVRAQPVAPPEMEKLQSSSSPTKSVSSPPFTTAQRLVSPTAPIMYRAVAAPIVPSGASIVRAGMPTLSAASIRPPPATTRISVATTPTSAASQGMQLIQAASVSSTTPAKSSVAAPPAPYNASNAVPVTSVSRILSSQSPIRVPTSSTLPGTSTLLPTSIPAGALQTALQGGLPQGTVLLRAPDGRIVRANAAAFSLGAQTLQVAPAQQSQAARQPQMTQLRLVQQLQQEQQQAQQQAQQLQQRQQQQRQATQHHSPQQISNVLSSPTSMAPPRLLSVSDLSTARANASGSSTTSTRAIPASAQTRQTQGDINSAIQNRVASGAPPLRLLVPGSSGMVQLQQPLNAATLAALQRQQLQFQLAQQQRQASQTQFNVDQIKK